jgi:type III restriction enzyme
MGLMGTGAFSLSVPERERGQNDIHNYLGAVRRYFPDFIIRLKNGTNLVLEVKGQKSPESDTKHAALKEWIEAVNNHGGFGKWTWDVSYHPSDLASLLGRFDGGNDARR